MKTSLIIAAALLFVVTSTPCSHAASGHGGSHSARPVCNNQAVHILGGSGTDPEQNDLLFQIYKWAQPKDGCLELHYYTGIKIWPAFNVETIAGMARDNICRQIKDGVKDIYLFGFSRGSVVAVALADIKKQCPAETKSRTDADEIVKFVGLVDPVAESMGDEQKWPKSLPAPLASNGRSLVIKKAIHQGLGDVISPQQFYFDAKSRIRVYGNMCLQAPRVGDWDQGLTIQPCSDTADAQKFITQPKFDAVTSSGRIKSLSRNAYVTAINVAGFTWFEIKDWQNDPKDQLFSVNDKTIGQLHIWWGDKCMSVEQDKHEGTAKDTGKKVVVRDCGPKEGLVPGLLSTTPIANVEKTVTVPGLWHQDLACTLDVTDDGLAYTTNATKYVENVLIKAAQDKGLTFPNQRKREVCNDLKPQGGIKVQHVIRP
ncbi:MAG: RICIN domain-containing protein [Thermodesulfovibrionales bacterium]|nr:RICIN domain-containing protein [Thermodesulfovibrionales bacterium]